MTIPLPSSVSRTSLNNLERFFVLDSVDRDLLGDRRGDHNRLGLMVQATTVRYIGVFLKDPVDVPWPVVAFVAEPARHRGSVVRDAVYDQ